MVKNMLENVTKLASELDEKHSIERRRLVKMDLKDLKAMMPELVIFHEDLREHAPKNDKEDIHVARQKVKRSKYYYESDSDDTVDMPIDYKLS